MQTFMHVCVYAMLLSCVVTIYRNDTSSIIIDKNIIIARRFEFGFAKAW